MRKAFPLIGFMIVIDIVALLSAITLSNLLQTRQQNALSPRSPGSLGRHAEVKATRIIGTIAAHGYASDTVILRFDTGPVVKPRYTDATFQASELTVIETPE